MARKKGYSTGAAGDDDQIYIIRRDLSGGTNDRTDKNQLPENQGEKFYNVDLGTPGARIKRPGLQQIADLGATSPAGIFGFNPTGASSLFVSQESTNLKTWDLETPVSFTSRKTDLTTSTDTTFVKCFKTGVGDVVLFKTDNDNWFEMTQAFAFTDLGSTAGTGSDSPPSSKVAEFFRNRLWILKNDLLYFSDASPSNYATAFDTVTNYYRINVGDERTLLGTRDLGLIVAGKEAIWVLNPSLVPAATDKPEKLLDIGVAAGRTMVQVGDDYLFFAFDGVRGLKRTIQDKVQLGQSYPLSYPLKTEFDRVSWGSISKACAIYWDNKYFISLPVDGSSSNNIVWVYWPATNAWAVVDGWKVSCWTTAFESGKEVLFAGEATDDGLIYRAWAGTDDNGTAITYEEIGKNEDMGQPLVRKVGGEVKVSAKSTGDYTISVYVSLDDSGYNLLGTVSLTGGLVTFPVTFPVNFGLGSRSYQKFHLDGYGPWYTVQVRLTNADTTALIDEIKILEHSVTAMLEEYISEESN